MKKDYILNGLTIVMTIIFVVMIINGKAKQDEIDKLNLKFDKMFKAFSVQTDINTEMIEMVKDIQRQVYVNSNRLNQIDMELTSKLTEGVGLQIEFNDKMIEEINKLKETK